MELLIITLIITIILILIVAIIITSFQKRQINSLKSVSKNVANMNILQNMLEIMSSKFSSDEKIKNLNDVIITNYGVKYSTISTFDGYEYDSTASNIEAIYKDRLKDIANENDFKVNISKNVSKYLTTAPGKTLLYRSAVERRIKSAMFSPIYCNGVYLGFWLLEDTVSNAFDNIPKSELAKLKANIGTFLDIVGFQRSIEKAQNEDKQTGFYTNLYLYSGARKIIKNNENNTIAMVCLKNIPDINLKYGRNVGNAVLIKATNCIKNFVNKNIILIRYSGIKFLIIIPNMSSQASQPMIERLLAKLNLESEYVGDEKITVNSQFLLHTVKNQNDIDFEIEKMVDYIDGMNSVNTIKII
ncbi:diguanylate cyclase [Clostridium sp. CAG:465]|jgi:diguanylate cyclase (GGDEF)-like protein|nr:diguanylate cyclase [Clostridium sp. CAG:465]